MTVMDYRQQIITLAEAYSQATGRSEARISTLVHNTGVFFKNLREGKGCSVDTYLKVKRWFADNWPTGVEWPNGVDPVGVLPSDEPDGNDEMMAALSEAIMVACGPVKLGELCGVSVAEVAEWMKRRRVAAAHVARVSHETGVARSWLRPDLYPPDEAKRA